MDPEVAQSIQLSQKAIDMVDNHVSLYERDRQEFNERYISDKAELDKKLGGIFRRLESLNNRGLALAGTIILMLISGLGWCITFIMKNMIVGS